MNKYFFLFMGILISSCSPSTISIQTAIAETQAVISTNAITQTPLSTQTSIPEPSLTAIPNLPSPNDVISSFKAAGLEAENYSAMKKDDYGLAPFVCQGIHFFIPSLGPDNGGRLFVCPNDADRDLLKSYYNELGRQSALFYSWVFVKGPILVQINGDLPEAIARQYEAAIP